MSEKVESYLNKKKNVIGNEEVAQHFKNLEDLYTKKQWYQLSDLVAKLVVDNLFTNTVELTEFYEEFINETEHRFNVLQLIEIIIPIAKLIFNKDRNEAFEFFKKFEKIASKDDFGFARLRTGQIEFHLLNVDVNGKCPDISLVKKLLNETQEMLDKCSYITPVHPSFYKMSSKFMDYTCDFAGYYNETLKYISCEDPTILLKDSEESKSYAVKLIVAAILGENLYDFGVLIANPILDSLRGTDFEWMIEMLQSINSGDLKWFNSNKHKWEQFNEIITNEGRVREKIQLFCFMEVAMVNRLIPFAVVADKAQVLIDEVEFLAMKAFSRELVWGSIDQVDEVINIEWVKPRALSLEQIKVLADRVSQWRTAVNGMGDLIQVNAQDILAGM